MYITASDETSGVSKVVLHYWWKGNSSFKTCNANLIKGNRSSGLWIAVIPKDYVSHTGILMVEVSVTDFANLSTVLDPIEIRIISDSEVNYSVLPFINPLILLGFIVVLYISLKNFKAGHKQKAKTQDRASALEELKNLVDSLTSRKDD
ncbi:MAG: hypothetical protein ACTSPV_13685 [Candidatus Hodarchaeales archaeon]